MNAYFDFEKYRCKVDYLNNYDSWVLREIFTFAS